jgi:hypothetical protein
LRNYERSKSALDICYTSPVSVRSVGDGKVSLKDAYRIRRWFRRLAKMRGRGNLRRLKVFIRHENVVRLLEFLGYRQEE